MAVTRGRPVPAAWQRPGFAVRVERFRDQLRVIATASLLVDSFSREALHARPWTDAPSALRVAYAIRWIELGANLQLPGWTSLIRAEPTGPSS